MKNNFTPFYWPALLGGVLILTACGGGGGSVSSGSDGLTYSGLTTPAAVSSSNAEELSTTTPEAVSQAVLGSYAASTNPLKPYGVVLSGTTRNSTALPKPIIDITKRIQPTLPSSDLPIGVTQSGTYSSDDINSDFGATVSCGGSVTYSITYSGTGDTESGKYTFNNLCIDMGVLMDGTEIGEVTLNGTMTFADTETEWTYTYTNFTVTNNGDIYNYSGTEACSKLFPYECTSYTTYIGTDDSIYKIEDSDAWCDNSCYAFATFYNPTYGSVTLSAMNVTFECPDGYPNSGEITITGTNDSSATIIFRSDCTGFDGSWNDGSGGTGNFSYNWPV
jgi:hypothetical protein